MFIFFIFICIFLVTQGFLVLDEEMLIIMASVFWVDAAGGMIRKAINNELVLKGSTIKDKFVWFLDTKKLIILDLVKLHQERTKLPSQLNLLFGGVVSKLVTATFVNFYNNLILIKISSRLSLVTEMCSGLAESFYYEKLDKTLSIVSDSGSDMLFIGDNNTHAIYGSTKDLVFKV